MRLLYLASIQPSFGHFTAARTVLAHLLLETARAGHQALWATLKGGAPAEPEAVAQLAAAGVEYLGEFESELEPVATSFGGRLQNATRRYLAPASYRDHPRFRDPAAVARRLRQADADVAVLYWDTWFEHLLPHQAARATIGYLGRPRYASPLAVLPLEPPSLARNKELFNLERMRTRHLARVAGLAGMANICALDAAMYRAAGIDCSYIPNTWPDAIGEDWLARREAAEAAAEPGAILGNIGGLAATGNRFGMEYIGAEVLPRLDRLAGDLPWRIALCGRGEPTPALKRALDHPRIAWKGFVPDIDAEVLSSKVFLLCNNAGPYTGGYTRVIYAMSAGSCLVAHRSLAQSMPEVIDGENALLGDDGESIAAAVLRALRDPGLRRRIGSAARRTYVERYRPSIVVRQLTELAAAALAPPPVRAGARA